MTLKNIRYEDIKTIDDSILHEIIGIVNRKKQWSGTMTELSSELENNLGEDCPINPSLLSRIINRIANRLRYRGVSIKSYRTPDKIRTKIITFSK